MFDPKKIKEDALKNATLITEEERRDLSTLTTEEMCNLVLVEFNKLADKIEKECWPDFPLSVQHVKREINE